MRVNARKSLKQSINGLLLLVAIALFGYALLTTSPSSLVQGARSMVASAIITSSAAVPANSDNTLAQQLREKEMTLNEREQRVAQLEEIRNQSDNRSTTLSLISLGASLVLFGLVALNFYRDAQRNTQTSRSAFTPTAIDLRRTR